jgi:hypothetical protein
LVAAISIERAGYTAERRARTFTTPRPRLAQRLDHQAGELRQLVQ